MESSKRRDRLPKQGPQKMVKGTAVTPHKPRELAIPGKTELEGTCKKDWSSDLRSAMLTAIVSLAPKDRGSRQEYLQMVKTYDFSSESSDDKMLFLRLLTVPKLLLEWKPLFVAEEKTRTASNDPESDSTDGTSTDDKTPA